MMKGLFCIILLLATVIVSHNDTSLASSNDIDSQFADIVSGMDPFGLKKDDESTTEPKFSIEPAAKTKSDVKSIKTEKKNEKDASDELDDTEGEKNVPWKWYYLDQPDLNWIFNDKSPVNINNSRKKAQSFARSRLTSLVKGIISSMYKNGADLYSFETFLHYLFGLWPKTGIGVINIPADNKALNQEQYLKMMQNWSRMGHFRSYEPIFIKGAGTSENYRALLLNALDYYVFMVSAGLWTDDEKWTPDKDKIISLIKERPHYQPVILMPFTPGMSHHAVARIDAEVFVDGSYASSNRSQKLENSIKIYDFWASSASPNQNWKSLPLDKWSEQLLNLFGDAANSKGFRLASTHQPIYPMMLPGGPVALGPASINIMLGGTIFRPSWIKGQAGPGDVMKAVKIEEPERYSGPVIMLFARRDSIRNGHFLKKELFADPDTNPNPERNILRKVISIVEKNASESIRVSVKPALEALWRAMLAE